MLTPSTITSWNKILAAKENVIDSQETAQSPRLALNLYSKKCSFSHPSATQQKRRLTRGSPCLYSAGLLAARVTTAFRERLLEMLHIGGLSSASQGSGWESCRGQDAEDSQRQTPTTPTCHCWRQRAHSSCFSSMCGVPCPCSCIALGTESRPAYILGKYSTTDQQPQSMTYLKISSEGKGKSTLIVGKWVRARRPPHC